MQQVGKWKWWPIVAEFWALSGARGPEERFYMRWKWVLGSEWGTGARMSAGCESEMALDARVSVGQESGRWKENRGLPTCRAEGYTVSRKIGMVAGCGWVLGSEWGTGARGAIT